MEIRRTEKGVIQSLENKFLKYQTEIKIVQDTIHKLNPEFSLCDILVCYHGKNRNKSYISKELIEQKLFSIYGVPLVGEWIRLEEDQNKETWGSHGGRLIIDDAGIKYEQTTKPFGFVTEESQQTASWVTITEKDGHTQNEYLLLKKCILWSERYEECKTILDKNYGQSMELSQVDGSYTDENYFELSDFLFSALCILGDECPACFESASIGVHKEYKKFKEDYQFMLEQYKKFNLESSQEDTNLDINKTQTESQDVNIDDESVATNNYKEEDRDLAKVNETQLNQEKVNAKLSSVISENKFRANTDKHYIKYEILSNTDSVVDVMDREDCYKIYSIPYLATETSDDIVISIDYENKIEKSFGIVDKTDDIFNIKKEVDMISDDTADYKVSQHTSNTISTLTSELETMTDNYNKSEAEIKRLTSQLEIFQKEKETSMAQKHRESIDTLIASKRDEMGNYSKFLEYCIEPDYNKTIEQIEGELKEIRYEFLDSASKTKINKNTNFSVIKTEVVESSSDVDNIAKLYGSSIAKFFGK